MDSGYLWKTQLSVVQNISRDLYVTETNFDYTIQGQIQSKQNAVSCFSVSVANANDELKRFWNLESIGIIDMKIRKIPVK